MSETLRTYPVSDQVQVMFKLREALTAQGTVFEEIGEALKFVVHTAVGGIGMLVDPSPSVIEVQILNKPWLVSYDDIWNKVDKLLKENT